jgi:predicted DNA-binding transcriptional regulator AlpA
MMDITHPMTGRSINLDGIVLPEREVMTLPEAADFLRFSRSTMHQRRDIPRHPVPGSRQIRYLRSELLAWLKGELTEKSVPEKFMSSEGPGQGETPLIDIATRPVYHRNGQYW